MISLVADTDALSHYMKGVEPWRSFVAEGIRSRSLAVTVTTAVELHEARELRKRARLLLDAIPALLALDGPSCFAALDLRERLEAAGKPIGISDCLIAGVCLTNGLPLLTGNVRHFERVPGLELLRPG